MRGRPPANRIRAVKWLAQQPWFQEEWRDAPTYKGDRQRWRIVADAVRDKGFYSQRTGTIDVPVGLIVEGALALRSAK